MVQMKSKISGTFLVINLFIQSALPVFSCGFYETEADYQAMMFRAMLPNMKCFMPFHYTTSGNYYTYNWYYNFTTDLSDNDRYRNCSEWLAICDNSVFIQDISEIQYNTKGDMFIKSYSEKSLTDDFKNNSFIEFLVKEENRELLDYMLFAKKMELTEIYNDRRFEEWSTSSIYRRDGEYEDGRTYWDNYNEWDKYDRWDKKSELLQIAHTQLNKTSSPFLKQRYAFQVCRLKYQLGKTEDILQIFNQYFGKTDPNSLMSIWAAFFTGMSLEDDNRYAFLIQSFMYSDEKKLRSVQQFDNFYNPDLLTKSEHSMAIIMTTLQDPGRVIDRIREAYTLDKNNKYIPFLILREVNKLEDWMITPLFYGKYSITNTDVFTCDKKNGYGYIGNEEEYYSDFQKLRAENIRTDKQYLRELKTFLTEILPQSNGYIKDYYSICLAHLCLLQENAAEANKYLSMISVNANPTIKLQQKLETIWLAIKTQDIHSEKFKSIFMENISDLEKIKSPGYDNRTMLYTLTLSLANEYFKKNDKVYGNLMRLKSNIYHNITGEWSDIMEDYYYARQAYYFIEYFDYNATTSDIDQLIKLMEKDNKTDFEKYLCKQPLPAVNVYKDLKGTLAFRNNDLQLAYETFSSMPEDYWQSSNGLYFNDYLNENPFEAKGLKDEKYRNFDYKFNKAEFVKQLIDLKKQSETDKNNRLDCYIKLGNAYFNVSYFGNSWMMTRYRWSTGYRYYADNMDCLPQWYQNYLTASIARQYFETVLKETDNKEQSAYASLMLYHIYRSRYYASYHWWDDENTENEKSCINLAKQYCQQFFQYNTTKTFRLYECPGMEWFCL